MFFACLFFSTICCLFIGIYFEALVNFCQALCRRTGVLCWDFDRVFGFSAVFVADCATRVLVVIIPAFSIFRQILDSWGFLGSFLYQVHFLGFVRFGNRAGVLLNQGFANNYRGFLFQLATPPGLFYPLVAIFAYFVVFVHVTYSIYGQLQSVVQCIAFWSVYWSYFLVNLFHCSSACPASITFFVGEFSIGWNILFVCFLALFAYL